jgi:hypothetical protein
MSYTIEFLSRARKELLSAWEWYEDKKEGLEIDLRMKFTVALP